MRVRANRTIVSSQMNHHVIWIGWQQGSKHVYYLSLLFYWLIRSSKDEDGEGKKSERPEFITSAKKLSKSIDRSFLDEITFLSSSGLLSDSWKWTVSWSEITKGEPIVNFETILSSHLVITTRSKVCPSICVEPFVCRVRLEVCNNWINSVECREAQESTCILKSPTINKPPGSVI